jgi:hypothetical protein
LLRRVLAVALAAAIFAVVPGAASAAPHQDAPKNTFRADYAVSGQVTLPDGRQAQYSLAEHRDAASGGWTASLYLSTWTYRDCGMWQCQENLLIGQTALDADDVHFARNLSQARAVDVPVVLQSWTWSWPEGGTYTDVEEVTVSLEFTSSGPVSRSNYHGDLCSDGQTACQANSLQSSRDAVGTLTVGEQVVPTSASIQYMQSNETAPKPVEGDGQPLPPGGEYPPPPPAGEYPPPPVGDGASE